MDTPFGREGSEGSAPMGHAFGVHSEHDLKEQSDAQIIVSRFPFRGEGSEGSKGSARFQRAGSKG
jgi:hypothetical protein